MNEVEFKQYQKLINENIDSAVKLIEINKNLQNKIENYENQIDNLKDDINYWKGKYNDLLDDLEENYKPIPVAEQVGISERDFY